MSIKKSCKRPILAALASIYLLAGVSAPALAEGLFYDAEHDVFVLPTNELTVRYNSKTFAPVKATKYGDDAVHFLQYPLLTGVKIEEDFSKMNISQSPESIQIECYDSGPIGPMGTNRISKDFLKENKVTQVSYNHEKIAKETGMPVSALRAMKAILIFEVKPKSGAEAYNLFAFQHDGHTTMFARRMRSGRADVKNDPPVIIVDMRLGSIKDSKANVEFPATAEKTASEGTPSGQ
ncbi:hypothetical protein KF728_06445 [Candidatus Obscuribacterales bacterium]|nr:hypothetical protein [Candidatus Obscuribacterales bacterium]